MIVELPVGILLDDDGLIAVQIAGGRLYRLFQLGVPDVSRPQAMLERLPVHEHLVPPRLVRIDMADLNGQALAWCNKVNGKVHATTNEVPFERLKKEGLSPLSREYIIDKINLRRVQKDCLISYAGNQYSVPAEYVGKDVAVVALDSMLAAYYEGKQIALHRISYQRKDMVVNPQHYRRLTLKQTIDAENVLLEQDKVIDFPLKPSDLSRYDEALYD